MKLLLLCTGKPSTHLVKAIQDAGHTYEVYDPRELYLLVTEKVNGYDRIFDGSIERETPVRLYANSFDAVICRIGKDLQQCLPILRHLTQNLGIYSAQSALGLLIAHDKLWTTQRLSEHNLPVPLTFYAIRPNHVDFAITSAGGLPVVAKQLTGSQGAGVSIFETPLSANTTLESFHKAGIPIKLQRFVKAQSNETGQATDIRAIVVGNKVAVAMERSANQGDFRANLSKGGTGKVVELTEAEQAICIKATHALSLRFAGVDLMREGDKSYVTEVNGNPGTGIIAITGHNYFVDLVSYVTGMVAKEDKETKEEKVKQELPAPKPVQIVDLTNPMHLAKHMFEKLAKKAG